MKFTVLPNVLKAAVAAITPALSNKNAMPILDNILLTPSDDAQHIALTASSSDFTIVTQMEVMEPQELVPALIPAKNIREFISRALGAFPVDFSYNAANGEWSLTDDFGEVRFISDVDVKAYPVGDYAVSDAQFSITVPAAPIVDAMTAAKGFVANDDLRPVMNGVYLDFAANGLHVVASDSKSLFRDTLSDVTPATPASVIVPSRMLASVKSLFATSADAQLTIAFNAKNVCFSQGSTYLRGRLIEGKFPRYEAVIPKNNNAIADVDVSRLNAAVNRASISANSATNQICLAFDGATTLTISAQDVDFSTSSKATIATTSQQNLRDFKIGVRANILCSCLSIFKASNVLLTFSDPARAIVIKAETSGRIALMMPMQLQN